MSRGTLSTGGHVVGVHKYGNATLGFEFFEPKTKRTSASSPAMDEDVTALLRGQFVLKLPAYSSSEKSTGSGFSRQNCATHEEEGL